MVFPSFLGNFRQWTPEGDLVEFGIVRGPKWASGSHRGEEDSRKYFSTAPHTFPLTVFSRYSTVTALLETAK
jgi:hypothetical protein